MKPALVSAAPSGAQEQHCNADVSLNHSSLGLSCCLHVTADTYLSGYHRRRSDCWYNIEESVAL